MGVVLPLPVDPGISDLLFIYELCHPVSLEVFMSDPEGVDWPCLGFKRDLFRIVVYLSRPGKGRFYQVLFLALLGSIG